MLKDPAHDLSIGDESDEFSLPAVPGAGEHVDLEHALQEARPRWPVLLASSKLARAEL
jgi:hypothetical protein